MAFPKFPYIAGAFWKKVGPGTPTVRRTRTMNETNNKQPSTDRNNGLAERAGLTVLHGLAMGAMKWLLEHFFGGDWPLF